MRFRIGLALFAAGGIALALVVPYYGVAQPRGLSITRADAVRVADAEARTVGVDPDRAWRVVRWASSDILEKELGSNREWRKKAEADPALAPRLGFFMVTYFRKAPAEKWPAYGWVCVGRDGQPLAARRFLRSEDGGANPTADALRARADAFVSSRAFPGAPAPAFESVRPTVLTKRTDHVFRYTVKPSVDIGTLDLHLGVYFVGDQPAGWDLFEEYTDGRRFRYESGQQLVGLFGRMIGIVVLLGILASIFIKKYHAGEVGVRASTFLFCAVLALAAAQSVLTAPAQSYGTNFGAVDAFSTAVANAGFEVLFYFAPVALLVFLGWAVGESRARERWGDKLAAFDAILRRDPLNANVGGSVLLGLLVAPAVAAISFLLPLAPLSWGLANVALGESEVILSAVGGPWTLVLIAVGAALTQSVVALLFNLSSAAKRKRAYLPIFILLSLLTSLALTNLGPPIEPFIARVKFGVGASLASAFVFLWADLLTAAIGLFSAYLLVSFLPFLSAVSGAPLREAAFALGIPVAVLLAFAVAGLATRRAISYSYEDLAPHVKRIVERERVKAEIDAANRIQAALLPERDPQLDGATVASHYQAATEIGGDYFDFLPLPNGQLGIAFGDVSGHGLTSGIVMSMAKAALLVQVGYDSTPVRVMEVLNESVRRTAPKRILMTFFYGVLDVAQGELRFSSAGHLDPYVYRGADGTLEPLSAWGFPLGVKRREPFQEFVATFESGDRLILYSDGLIEAMGDDDEPYGFPRFERTILDHGTKSAVDIKNALLQSVKRFTRSRPAEDDQTLVVVGFEDIGRERLRKAS